MICPLYAHTTNTLTHIHIQLLEGQPRSHGVAPLPLLNLDRLEP